MTPGGMKLGALAVAIAAALIWMLPSASLAGGAKPGSLNALLQQTTTNLSNTLQKSLDETEKLLRATEQALLGKKASGQQATPRATATDPPTQPPLHGSNPHGQGSVLVVDLNPSSERPLGGNPNGSDAGPEDIIVGRARGEKNGDNFHGHVTILALLGNELAGVDTNEGETANGPLQPIQDNVLDPLCAASGNQVCLLALAANSTTTSTGSTNDFAIARASALGLVVGAAQSAGAINETAACQTSFGGVQTANVMSATAVSVADVANASSVSQSCQNQAPQTVNTSTVIGLGGVAVPLPAAGCADGTPDTETGVPPILPIVCNANEIVGAAAVREALDVFLLAGEALKESTASAESISVAPTGPENGGPECSDGADNDGDGDIDANDPGCHTDGDPDNPDSYDPNDDDESNDGGDGDDGGDGPGTPACSDNVDNDGDGVSDENDPGCHSDGNPNNPDSYNPNDDSETNGGGGPDAPACSDGVDNDSDGVSDARDPGCHTDGDPNNPNSYNPNDDDEGNGQRTVDAGTLPFTGADLTGLGLAGLLLLAGGLVLRRREGARSR